MRTFGIGIIGTGSIANSHRRGYEYAGERCVIRAVADIDLDRAKSFARECGEDTAAYADYKELLARDDVEVVSICTPPFTHAGIAIDALRAGKHVLVEKPMAASLDEADRMIAAAEGAGRKLAVVFQNRWRPDWMRAKALIDSEHFGKVLFGKVDCLWWRGPEYYDMWWRGTWEQECGGVMMNHAIHFIDGLLWFMGEARSVYAVTEAVHHDVEVEDFATAIVYMQSGATAVITGTVAAHHNTDRIEIFGTKAGLTLPWKVHVCGSRPTGFPLVDEEREQQLNEFQIDGPVVTHRHGAQIVDLLDAIETDRKPLVDGAEGRRSLELVTAVYKSAAVGERVELPIRPDDPFYSRQGLLANVRRFQRSEADAG